MMVEARQTMGRCPIRWIDFPSDDLTVSGLPFFRETRPRLLRLPERARELVREPVWDLAGQTSGARVRFRSTGGEVGLRLRYPPRAYMQNMTRMGQSGVDCYVNGRYCKTASPAEQSEAEFTFPLAAEPREAPASVDLHLPLYAPVEVLAVGVDDDAEVSEAAAYRLDRPVVYYGSSITQGGCASRPGMSYPAILSRMLDVDFVNLGFSGQGKGEPEVAGLVAEVEAAGFVLDWAGNCDSVEQCAERYAPFYRTVREKHPDAPIVMLTSTHHVGELFVEETRRNFAALREVIREVYASARAAGDVNVRLVEGTALIGPDDEDGLVDGVHPNDIGFRLTAERLRPVLREVLGLGL